MKTRSGRTLVALALSTFASMLAIPVDAASPGDPARGKELYGEVCASCHGQSGEGGVGPRLQDLHTRRDTASTVEWIKQPSPKMPRFYPNALDDQDVLDLAAYLAKL
jgi:mono/diheme cytochrome c family protein